MPEDFDPEYALADLLRANVCFLRGDIEFCQPAVVSNDIFIPGSDYEELEFEELEPLWLYWKSDKKWGSTIWCMRQNYEQPQAHFVEAIKRDGLWEPWMDGLRQNQYELRCKEAACPTTK